MSFIMAQIPRSRAASEPAVASEVSNAILSPQLWQVGASAGLIARHFLQVVFMAFYICLNGVVHGFSVLLGGVWKHHVVQTRQSEIKTHLVVLDVDVPESSAPVSVE